MPTEGRYTNAPIPPEQLPGHYGAPEGGIPSKAPEGPCEALQEEQGANEGRQPGDRLGALCEACGGAEYGDAQVVLNEQTQLEMELVTCPNCGEVVQRYIQVDEVEERREANAKTFIETRAAAVVEAHRAWLDEPHEDGEFTGTADAHLQELLEKELGDHLGPLGDLADAVAAQNVAGWPDDFGMPWWMNHLMTAVGRAAADVVDDKLSHPGMEFEAILKNGGNILTFQPPADNYGLLRKALLEVGATVLQMLTRIDEIGRQEAVQQQAAEDALKRLGEYALKAHEIEEARTPNAAVSAEVYQDLAEGEQACRLLMMAKAGRKVLEDHGMSEDSPIVKHALAERMVKLEQDGEQQDNGEGAQEPSLPFEA